jgi:CheY-like chemotaxis protein
MSAAPPVKAVPTILVVDDEPALLRLMAFVLQKQGYSMITATNGDEALAMLNEHHPDLVVLDIMMPRRDGYQVAEEIRANPTLAATPIVMLSAKAQEEDIERGMAAGVNTYITKPFAPENLTRIVAALLAGEAVPQRMGLEN